jgi:chain length determinant protein EpsF
LSDWLAARLSQKLEIRPARDSSVLNLSYTATDPDFAAAVANAFARAYMDVNLDLRLAPARQYASFFAEQTGAARDRLERAQAVLSSYQQNHGITSSDEKMDFETARLNETSSQLTQVQGQTTDSQSKRQTPGTDTVAEVMQSPLTNGMKADIARLEAKLADNSGNLGKNHPQTLRSELELASLRAQLQAETQKITRSIDTAYEVSRQRERSLQGSLASQKSRVLSLNKQRDELTVMQRDVESAQRAFEVVSQRASQATIESRANQTNISLLSPAVAPMGPSRPRLLLNGLLSVILGGLLGCTIALVTELTHRRIRSVEDLQEALSIPSLGAVALAPQLTLRREPVGLA